MHLVGLVRGGPQRENEVLSWCILPLQMGGVPASGS